MLPGIWSGYISTIRYVFCNTCLSIYNNVIPDGHIIPHTCLSIYNGPVSYMRITGNSHLRYNDTVFTDGHIVTNFDHIINSGISANYGIRKCSSLYHAAGSNRHPVFQDCSANSMKNFQMIVIVITIITVC